MTAVSMGYQVTEPFEIPVLQLMRPDALVNECIMRVRQDRIKAQLHAASVTAVGQPEERIFSEEELSFIYKAFQAHDERDSGQIPCREVHGILEDLGVPVSAAWLVGFFTSISAEPDTPLTFADLVDIVAIASQVSTQEAAAAEEEGYEIPQEDP